VKIWLKIALNAARLPKFEPFIVVTEKDHGKRFTATFRAGVILRMRRELRGLQFLTTFSLRMRRNGHLRTSG